MSYGGGYGGAGGYGGGLVGGPAAAPLVPWAFDTGIGKPARAVVQDGICDLLSRLLVANGGYIKAIEPIGSTIESKHDDDGIALALDQLNGRAPAILVATGEKPYRNSGDAFNWYGEIKVHLYFAVNSLRGRMARLTADVVALADPMADQGILVMLEHAEMLLIGQAPGSTRGVIKEIRPIIERPLIEDNTIALWEQIYTVVGGQIVNPNRDVRGELRSISTYSRLAEQDPGDTPVVATLTVIT